MFVPFLSVTKQNEANRMFPILGRILSHSAALLHNLTVRLCRSTLLTICHSPTEADEECVLRDFFNFVTGSERIILEKALRDYKSLNDSDLEEIQFIFGRFGMGVVIRKENVSSMVGNLARQELCVKPLFFCTVIKSGFPKGHQRAFWDNSLEKSCSFLSFRPRNKMRPIVSFLFWKGFLLHSAALLHNLSHLPLQEYC